MQEVAAPPFAPLSIPPSPSPPPSPPPPSSPPPSTLHLQASLLYHLHGDMSKGWLTGNQASLLYHLHGDMSKGFIKLPRG